jgi:KaiC/GvpD/RAD55 family RecA-like ATPase
MVTETPLERLQVLPKNSVVLVLIPRKSHEQLHLGLIDFVINKLGTSGVYVTLNRSYSNLGSALKSHKINPEKLLFIDCITKREPKVHNSIFLKTPQSLTSIGVALEQVYKKKGLSVIFFDSLDSLALYHDQKVVARFARSLVEKLREHGKRGILIGLQEETDKKLVDELSVICDTVIELGE